MSCDGSDVLLPRTSEPNRQTGQRQAVQQASDFPRFGLSPWMLLDAWSFSILDSVSWVSSRAAAAKICINIGRYCPAATACCMQLSRMIWQPTNIVWQALCWSHPKPDATLSFQKSLRPLSFWCPCSPAMRQYSSTANITDRMRKGHWQLS